jgi:hypothetical protein
VITSTARLLAALTLVAVAPGRCLAQESVQSAQALYASAAYDEALAVLDRLRAAERQQAQRALLVDGPNL